MALITTVFKFFALPYPQEQSSIEASRSSPKAKAPNQLMSLAGWCVPVQDLSGKGHFPSLWERDSPGGL